MRYLFAGILFFIFFNICYSQTYPLSAGTIGSSQTICYNTAPSRLLQLTTPRRGTGTYTYQWQYSTDKNTWNNISGETSTAYAPPVLAENRWFRLRVTSGPGTVITNPVLITVNPRLTSGTIEKTQSVCYNATPETLKQLSAPAGGTGRYDYQWQSSLNNSSWTDIPGATFMDYNSPAVTHETYYRRIVTSGTCGTVSSDPVHINVYPPLTSGTIGSDQSACYNTTPAGLTQLASPSGGTGNYNFQWQNSQDNSTWSDITGATYTDYSPASLMTSTFFRRNVTSGNCNTVSPSVRIKVNPQFTLVKLHDNISIFSNEPADLNVEISGGTPPYKINYSRNGVIQPTINNYISGTNISAGILSRGSYTFTLNSVTDASGCVANEIGTPVIIEVENPVLTSGSIGATQSICSNSVPATLLQITAPTGGNGDYIYQWQSSLDNMNWTNVDGATFSGYSPPALSENTYYRRIVTSDTYSASSTSVLISVLPPVTSVQLHDDSSIYSNAAANFNIVISGGNSPYTISYTRNGVIQPAIDNYISGTSISTGVLSSGSYLYAPASVTDSKGCLAPISGSAITITVYPPLTAGSIGESQSVCYNTEPAPLIQISAPAGGSGSYDYQWQRSSDNVNWTNITGAALPGYTPSALAAASYYRRAVRSGTSLPVYSDTVFINVLAVAQLFGNVTIYNNSSANFKIDISGENAPYTINYTCNGAVQDAISNYTGGTDISTGLLTTGIYNYALTSVTDADGHEACRLGTDITITVLPDPAVINNAIVLINPESSSYPDYINYVKPYLDNFGIPYTECDVSTTSLPEFHNFGIIIFGHKNVYTSGYPFTELETAVSAGSGLYSFDPHLFDYTSGFNTLIPQKSVNSRLISISNTSHYITQSHSPDVYNPDNNVVNLLNSWTVVQTSDLAGAVDLVEMSSGDQTISLMQVGSYGNGRIVKWCGYNWIFENILGPVYGMDDLLWRGIVWAARKPFAIQGMPPFITMRVDDATGSDGGVTDDFNWVKICNEFGLIPWCGTFNDMISPDYIPTLKSLIDNNKVTAFPHSFTWNNDFIYFNHNNLEFFDAAANTRLARDFYVSNGLKLSNYLVPHYYEISSDALPEIKAMGGDFLGIHILPDQFYYSEPEDQWINCGPYRLNRNGIAELSRPVYYGGNILLNGIEFFNCLTEIRDDGSYEWFPDNDVVTTVARGIRHLRRSLNSMVLSSLFTHEYYISPISTSNWREIISQVTTAISGYNPEFTSTDYAVKYIRARNNIKITNVVETNHNIEISYSGTNDMDTKCYLFTEESGEISYHFVALPQVSGSSKVNDPK